MYSELKPVADHGTNTLSPQVEAKEIELNAFVTFIRSTQDKTFVGLGDGSVQVYKLADELDVCAKEGFAALGLPICATICPSADSILVGTDHSTLLKVGKEICTVAQLDNGWIEQVAASTKGLIAYSSNRTCYVRNDSEQLCQIPQPKGTITGLQFSRDGARLAIARYDGVVIWDVEKNERIDELEQSGAHLNMSWSPDGLYLVTATPDKEIHCWDMKTKASFRMRGYPAKIRSMCWTADSKHLAVAGADSVTVWPFVNGSPSGKPPYEFGYSFKGVVTEVAAHPTETLVAAGFNNGTVLIGRYLKGEAIIARPPGGTTISAMSWSANGKDLFVGTESGQFSRIKLKDFQF